MTGHQEVTFEVVKRLIKFAICEIEQSFGTTREQELCLQLVRVLGSVEKRLRDTRQMKVSA